MKTRSTATLMVAFLIATPCFGSETIHLLSGFDLKVKTHSTQGDLLTLVTATGTIQIARSQVMSIEFVPDPPAVHPAATPDPKAKTPLDYLNVAARSQGDAPEFDRLVRSIAIVESDLNPKAVSPKGAIGLMQLMPSTAKLLGVKATDPDQNAKGGAQLLAQLLELYHYDSVRAVAAYNAGVAAVQKYGGVPPYAETQAYVRRVLKVYARLTATDAIGGGEAH